MLKKLYRDLKIRSKLSIIVIIEACLFSTVGLIALQYSFSIYDKQLYDNAEKVLNLYSVNIENILNGVNDLSYNILKDPLVQKNLATTKGEESSYEQFVLTNKMNELLQSWHVSASSSVLSLQIFDMNGREYRSTNYDFKLDSDRKSKIFEKALSLNGSSVWLAPSETDNAIVLIRSIRDITNLNLSNLGVLMIRVDPKALIGMYSQYLPKYDSNIYIISPDEVILGQKDDFDTNEIMKGVKGNNGYFISELNHKKFLVIYRKSTSSDWVFINTVPYEAIYENVIIIRAIVIFCYFILFVLLIFLGVKLSRSITHPIDQLIDKMKTIESGDFKNLTQMNLPESHREDEIGILQNDYNMMIKEIGNLIEENYIKQIMLKEFEYKALQAQINPHFLYNTLDSINWLAKINKQDKIAKMVKSLGDLLRSSISKKQNVVPLRDELKILNNYITIQKIRYPEGLEISVNIGEELYDHLITKLTLQPIVENSINYGLESTLGICRILIYARILTDKIEINVEDNGPGIPKEILEALNAGEIQSKGSGIGLKNINDRLKLIFGAQYGLVIDSVEEEGTTVHIYIPLENSKE